jgi:hypothetical protein
MIYYLATGAHLYTIRRFLESRSESFARTVIPMAYEDLFATLAEDSWWEIAKQSWWPMKPTQLPVGETLPRGTYIFSDYDRLSHQDATRAAVAWNMLAEVGDGIRLLNHPTRSMRRYELLRTLRELDINTFNVYRVTEARWPEQYPVIIRGENDHEGPRFPLLHSRNEIEEALALSDREGRSREDLLIVEFCDTADAEGLYRKFGAHIIGGKIFPRSLAFSQDWTIKGTDPNGVSGRLVDEEWGFVQSNPHEDALRNIFGIARIEYGRMDYAVLNGRIQVWEINSNPMITSGRADPIRGRVREYVGKSFEAACRTIDGG